MWADAQVTDKERGTGFGGGGTGNKGPGGQGGWLVRAGGRVSSAWVPRFGEGAVSPGRKGGTEIEIEIGSRHGQVPTLGGLLPGPGEK